MKIYFSIVALALAMTLGSCKNTQKQSQTTEAPKEQVTEAKVLTPETLMKDGAKLIDQNITIKGTVTHICKHGGKKCSIMGENPETFIQVMAGEKIGSFPTDLIGSNILVKGIVKERRITKEDVVKQEEALKAASEKAEKAENAEGKKHCSHSMHNVSKMKQWMTDNNKEYYPIYFVQGISFENVK